jgi:murein DD-endopeptidase MepM/ murein hydrolase activator NlpD
LIPTRSRSLPGWLCALALTLFAATAASGQEPVPQAASAKVSVEGLARQGDPLFISVTGPADAEGLRVKWDGHSYPLAPHKGLIGTVVPVRVDLAPGAHPLQILGQDGQQQLASLSVVIHSRWFPLQRLTINASTLASYDDPRNKHDDESIIDALRPFDPVQHWKGDFILPIKAPRTTMFGQKRVYNGWKKGWHKGTDLGGWEGQPIHAPAAAVVLQVARGLVNGNTVVLDHGMGLGTVYLHMQKVDVKTGQTITRGQVIGRVGGTGGFAPHLHWEARCHTVPIDPESLTQIPKDWQ